MAKRCVGSLHKKRGRARIAATIIVFMWRAARTSAAFATWKRYLGTINVACNHVSFDGHGPVGVLQTWPRRSSVFRSTIHHYFSSANSSDNGHDITLQKTPRHAVLDIVEESFEKYIIRSLKDSSGNVLLLVGVSGGCDSIGLLHALVTVLTRVKDNDIAFQLPKHADTTFQLHVVHFNHKQRGDASDKDAVFVQELCKDLKLPCHVYEWNSTDAASFSQDKARQWRQTTMYDLLQSLTSFEQQGVVLTAHHLNDSEESLVLKMIRGVHLTNLVGMEPIVMGTKEMPSAIIVRPLLNARKTDIVDFLTLNQLEWREDESNASNKYLRNRVRNELIPLLSDMVGGPDVLQKRLETVSEQSRELNDELTSRATEYLKDKQITETFVMSGESITLVEKEALHQWAKTRVGYPLPYDQLRRLCLQLQERADEQQWTLQVGGGWSIIRNGITLTALRDGMVSDDQEIIERELDWSLVENGGDNPVDNIDKALLIQMPANDDLVETDCRFLLSDAKRTKKWDFTPPWRENPMELRDFLRGQKVPLHRRGCAPVMHVKHQAKASLVAVFIEKKDGDGVFRDMVGKWVVNRKYKIREDDRSKKRLFRVQLPE